MLPPSDFLKADDLKIQGTNDHRDVDLTVSDIEQMQIGKETKWCLSFRGTKKTLPMNMANLKKMAELFGEESDGWMGQKVQLFVVDVQGPNGLVPGLRIRRSRVPNPAPLEQPKGVDFSQLGNVRTEPMRKAASEVFGAAAAKEFDPDDGQIPF